MKFSKKTIEKLWAATEVVSGGNNNCLSTTARLSAKKPCKLFSELTDKTKNASSADQRCGVNKF